MTEGFFSTFLRTWVAVLGGKGRPRSLGHIAHGIPQEGALVSVEGGVHGQEEGHIGECNDEGGGVAQHTKQDLQQQERQVGENEHDGEAVGDADTLQVHRVDLVFGCSVCERPWRSLGGEFVPATPSSL